MGNKISILTYLKRTLVLIGLFFIVLIVQLPIQYLALVKQISLAKLIGISLIYLAGFGLAIWLAYKAYRSVYTQTKHGLNKADWKLIGKALLFFYVVEIGLSILNALIYKQSGTENNEIILSLVKSNPVILVLMSFTMTFCSPVLEELVFRGYLIKGFFPKFKPLIPMLVSGAFFSIGHVSSNPISFLIYMSLGMILAYVYLKQDKIEVSIGLHFLNNLIATTLMIIGVLVG
ncbi:CPBP family intramembrane glutamic endopeptidase [Fructilactobacillus frigidiflavus]|uniref:CPBP family intramembrane glutamic endopeptidase n=1 Tax=Fructilactobacillus frigidiflavus TaxID=3242688 RepID=UPI003757BC82